MANSDSNGGAPTPPVPATPAPANAGPPVVVQPTTLPAAPAAAATAVLSSPPNVPALLKALRRRWMVAATLGIVLAAATAAGVWTFLPKGKNVAFVRLSMPLHAPNILYPNSDADGTFGSFQRAQIALLKSRLVLNAALKDPKVKALNLAAVTKSPNPVDWLEKEIKFDVTDGPELPRVVLQGDDPEALKVLVTAVVDAYLKEAVDRQKAHRVQRLDQLKELAGKYEERLKHIQGARNELAKAIGSSDNQFILLKQELAQKQLSLAQGELIRTDADLRRMELELKTYQGRDPNNIEVPDKLVETYVDRDLAAEVAARRMLEMQLAKDKEINSDDNYPAIRRLRTSIDEKNKAIEEKRTKLRAEYKTELVERAQRDAKSDIALLNEKIAFNTEFKRLLTKEIERLEGESHSINDKAMVLSGSDMDVQQAQAGYNRVMGEIDKVTVEMPAPLRVSLMEEAIAIPPDEHARKMKVAGGAGAGAFAAALLLVALLEWRARRLDSADDVVHGLGLELMGSLPAAPRRFGGRLLSSGVDTASWQAMLAESVDSARTLLLRAAGAGSLRSVMVTSAVSGEGKTSLATHLAASLARAGYRTLLVDGDLRKPAAHRIFGLPQSPGLSEFLRGEVGLADAVRPTQAERLFLLPAGEFHGGLTQLLARHEAAAVLDRLKQEYDFVVLDSSPVLPVADALLLAQHADGVLMALFHGVSRLPKVYAACHRLSMVRARVLGVVMNGTYDEAHAGYGRVVQASSAAV